MNDITLKTIAKAVLVRPASSLEKILFQENYRHAYFFPLLYGITTGVSKSVSKVGTSDLGPLIADSLFSIISSTLFTFIACFIYSWFVLFISNSLKGIANFKMTFAIISYSTIPMVLGATLILIIKFVVLSSNLTIETINWFNAFIYYYFQNIFVLWTLYVLVVGNAIINEFSIIKSIISSAGLVILGLLLVFLSRTK